MKFGMKASCRGCGEDIFPKSKVLIRCVQCTQQIAAASGSGSGNTQDEDTSATPALDNNGPGKISNSLPSASSMDLCPDCFAGRVEIGNHKAFHSYQFIDDGGFPIFPQTSQESSSEGAMCVPSHNNAGSPVMKTSAGRWTAREHLFLLTAIERHGYGNWEDISKAINTEMNLETKPSNINYRTPLAVMEEYTNIFLHGITGQRTWREDLRGRARDHTLGNPLLPPAQHIDPPTNLTTHEAIMLQYLPIRDDFEIEYENDAESLVSQLQFQPSVSAISSAQGPNSKSLSQGSLTTSIYPGFQEEDDNVDLELKVAHIDMYKMKLRERERRRRVAREHQLVNHFFRENPLTYDGRGRAVCPGPANSAPQKSLKKTSQKDAGNADVMERLKILAEFQGVSEYQVFMASMTKERDIKQRIKDLMRYRRNGIKNTSESVEYETQQRARRLNRKRIEKLRNQQKTQVTGSLLQTTSSLTNVESPLGSITSIEQSGWGSSASVATPSSVGADAQSPASSIKSEDYIQQTLAGSPLTPLTQQTQNYSPLHPRMQLEIEKPINSPQSLFVSNTGTPTPSFIITSFPGHEILSINEKRLCTNLRLTPAHYISYKTCLLTNHLQKKKGQTPKPLNPSGLDKNDRKVIFNFLMRAGWITAY